MTEIPQESARQAFVTDVLLQLERRVLGAERVRWLSKARSDRTVELVEDETGDQFVRRTYASSEWGGLREAGTFHTVWDAMHRNFARSGIAIVPSFIATPSPKKGEPIVVVSQFVQGARRVKEASLDAKKRLATGLGDLLIQSKEVLPQDQMLQPDMFKVGFDSDGKQSIMLIDVDPCVESRPSDSDLNSMDMKYAEYIDSISFLFYDHWIREGERDEVLGNLAKSLEPLISSDPLRWRTMKAIATVNMLRQGLDLRIKEPKKPIDYSRIFD